MKPWQIITIPPEEGKSSLTNVLGINDERAKELIDKLAIAHKQSGNLSGTLEAITGECLNINEAIFTAFAYGEHMGKSRNKYAIAEVPEEIKEFISQMLGVNEPEEDIDNPWQVSRIKDSNKIHESLGISKERLRELSDIIAKQAKCMIREDGSVSEAMQNISKLAENPNESHYMIFRFSDMLSQLESFDMNLLSEVINKLKKKHE